MSRFDYNQTPLYVALDGAEAEAWALDRLKRTGLATRILHRTIPLAGGRLTVWVVFGATDKRTLGTSQY